MIIYIPAQLVCSVMGGEGLFSLQGYLLKCLPNLTPIQLLRLCPDC